MDQTIPSRAQSALVEAAHLAQPVAKVERESIGCESAEVGAELVRRWGMRTHFSLTIRIQLDPTEAGDATLSAWLLCAGGRMSGQLEPGEIESALSAHTSEAALRVLGLTVDQARPVGTNTQTHLQDMVTIIYPRSLTAASGPSIDTDDRETSLDVGILASAAGGLPLRPIRKQRENDFPYRRIAGPLLRHVHRATQRQPRIRARIRQHEVFRGSHQTFLNLVSPPSPTEFLDSIRLTEREAADVPPQTPRAGDPIGVRHALTLGKRLGEIEIGERQDAEVCIR